MSRYVYVLLIYDYEAMTDNPDIDYKIEREQVQ